MSQLVPISEAATRHSRVDGCCILGPGKLRFPDDMPTKPRTLDKIAADLRAVIHELVEGRKPWPLFLHGEAGSGKTCAALCLLDRAGGWYLELPELCRRVIDAQQNRLTWSTGCQRTECDLWTDWGEVGLAVLDEIGTRERVSDFHYEILKRAVDLREGRPAIFISNLSLDAVYDQYDDRIASRLAAGTRFAAKGDRRLGFVPKLAAVEGLPVGDDEEPLDNANDGRHRLAQ